MHGSIDDTPTTAAPPNEAAGAQRDGDTSDEYCGHEDVSRETSLWQQGSSVRMFHVKHEELSQEAIARRAREFGIELSAPHAAALARHAEMVLETTQHMNLTAVVEPREFFVRHVIDSLMSETDVAAGPTGKLVDIGSGGGYPAIPLAIVSGRRLVMLESVAKKSRFLCEVIDALDMDATACAARAEEYALSHRDEFAVCTARAVADLAALVELAAPLLMKRGLFIGLKGDLGDDELRRGDVVGKAVGLRRTSVRRYGLGESAEKRAIVVYTKVAATPAMFPRRVGMAQNRPLA